MGEKKINKYASQLFELFKFYYVFIYLFICLFRNILMTRMFRNIPMTLKSFTQK